MKARYGPAQVAAALLSLLLGPNVLLPAAAASTVPGLRATTRSYVFTLALGMPEHIWTAAQARKMHPKTGELMLNGSMAAAMPMGDTQRELIIRIYSRATGRPVANAAPTISITDTSVKNGATVTVPVDELETVAASPNDVHYGNNIDLTGGDTYRVVVTLNGQRATLHAAAPRGPT